MHTKTILIAAGIAALIYFMSGKSEKSDADPNGPPNQSKKKKTGANNAGAGTARVN
jgi:hypothetical protein